MPKADKKPKAKILTPRESGYMLMPWSSNHYPAHSEVVAYVPITGEWEIVADIHNARGLDAEILAGLIARAVNSFVNNNDMIAQMTVALELCLECDDCLSWEAEHEAQALLNRVRRIA